MMKTYDAVMIAEGAQEASKQDYFNAWGQLIKSGTVWKLQGFFGRTASYLIDNGFISEKGDPIWEKINLGEE